MTVAEVADIARDLYRHASIGFRLKQGYRPYICPFNELIACVPPGASLLDAGCGAGLFILLLAKAGHIRSAVGFDTNATAIREAQRAAKRLQNPIPIHFEAFSAADRWPTGQFDVVSIIDVLHHVPPEHQRTVITSAVQHLGDGGVLLYKDMVKRPAWRAHANRAHDLLSVGEWINYVEIDAVIAWAEAAGLRVTGRGRANMLWYGHEWCTFTR
jgi:2-polyprenyl-3-methyl-5-hydroxy-6-metoxy-1,4-benzoquinol methylase